MTEPTDRPGEAERTQETLPSQLSALIREIVDSPRQGAHDAWEGRLAPGVVVGRFEMVREVGRGGFGIVYEAVDRALGRTVAFKAIKSGPVERAASEGVVHEAEVAAGLAHPAIATLFDAGRSDEGPYLVYEFLKGETLHRRLKRGPIPVDEAVRIAREAASGIAHAHANGVVHRDLTPSNVFLCSDGQVKILDLGMANAFGRKPAGGGTPGYMAPEQASGGPEDERTDVFGLGVLLYQMVANERPFWGKSPTPARRLDVPGAPGLGEVVAGMLALDPADRLRDGKAVLDGLERVQRSLERPPPTDAAAPPRKRPGRRLTLPWAAIAAVGLGALAWILHLAPFPSGAGRKPPVASVAVLPFADLSQQRDQRYLSDGLSEEILGRLSGVDGLRVPGRTSTLHRRDALPPLADLGRELGVDAVLEGSVRPEGNRIRVSAQLVSVRDGFRLWGATYDREFSDVFAVQDEIAKAVVDSLQVKLLGGGGEVARFATTSPEAYRHYLRARDLYRRYTPASLQHAIEEYGLALDADPDYAPAWAGLAIPLYVLAGQAETPERRNDGLRRAREAAEKAVALAPELPDAVTSRAALRLTLDRDLAGAQADIERAVAQNGGDPDSRRRYAMLLGASGRLSEAVEQARIAADLDPFGPSVGAMGKLYQAQGDLERADAAFRRHLRVEPGSLPSLLMLGQNLLLQGRAEEARSTFQAVPVEDYRLWGTALALHTLLRPGESGGALGQLMARFGHSRAFEIATIYAWMGQRDEAFAWLERALEQGDTRIPEMGTMEPLLAPLRADPRFGPLVARAATPVR